MSLKEIVFTSSWQLVGFYQFLMQSLSRGKKCYHGYHSQPCPVFFLILSPPPKLKWTFYFSMWRMRHWAALNVEFRGSNSLLVRRLSWCSYSLPLISVLSFCFPGTQDHLPFSLSCHQPNHSNSLAMCLGKGCIVVLAPSVSKTSCFLCLYLKASPHLFPAVKPSLVIHQGSSHMLYVLPVGVGFLMMHLLRQGTCHLC